MTGVLVAVKLGVGLGVARHPPHGVDVAVGLCLGVGAGEGVAVNLEDMKSCCLITACVCTRSRNLRGL